MNPERQFRLFSIACLGLAALACMADGPKMKTVSAEPSPIVVISDRAIEFANEFTVDPAMNEEVESAQLVNDINAGRFKPYELGALEVYQ